MKKWTKIISNSHQLSSNIAFASRNTGQLQQLIRAELVNFCPRNNFNSSAFNSDSSKNSKIDKQHLEEFRNQLRSDFKNESIKNTENPTDEETDRKKLHTKFYREVGRPFIKVVALTFITFYGMKSLYAYLESTDEDILKEKQTDK